MKEVNDGKVNNEGLIRFGEEGVQFEAQRQAARNDGWVEATQVMRQAPSWWLKRKCKVEANSEIPRDTSPTKAEGRYPGQVGRGRYISSARQWLELDNEMEGQPTVSSSTELRDRDKKCRLLIVGEARRRGRPRTFNVWIVDETMKRDDLPGKYLAAIP